VSSYVGHKDRCCEFVGLYLLLFVFIPQIHVLLGAQDKLGVAMQFEMPKLVSDSESLSAFLWQRSVYSDYANLSLPHKAAL
jgi:hypothetical protein